MHLLFLITTHKSFQGDKCAGYLKGEFVAFFVILVEPAKITTKYWGIYVNPDIM